MDALRRVDGCGVCEGGRVVRIAIGHASDRWIGGIETYIGLLLPALLGRGHEVLFLHERNDGTDRPAIPALDRVPCVSIARVGIDAAVREARAWKPDVLFAQGFEDPAVEMQALTIAPAVAFAHAYAGTCISGSKAHRLPDTRPCGRRFGPMCLALYYPRRCGGLHPGTALAQYRQQRQRLALLRSYRAVVTFSEHMRGEYLRHGFDTAHVTRLPAVYPSLLADPSGPDAHVATELRLCFVGRVERLKGLAVLIEALPQVVQQVDRPVRLVVAGDGPDADRCRAAADAVTRQHARLSVEFLGWCPQARCIEVATSSDVLVMPSLWPEPFGFTGAEAVRRGIPVAAFRSGAAPEWLTDGVNGSLAPADPPTADGLAQAIRRAAALGPQARTSVDIHADAAQALARHCDELLDVLARCADTDGMARFGPSRGRPA